MVVSSASVFIAAHPPTRPASRSILRAMRMVAAAAAALAVAASGTARAATLPANRCVALRGEIFFVKPTGLGTAMFSDRDGRLLTSSGRADAPGPAAEWALRPRGGHRYD